MIVNEFEHESGFEILCFLKIKLAKSIDHDFTLDFHLLHSTSFKNHS